MYKKLFFVLIAGFSLSSNASDAQRASKLEAGIVVGSIAAVPLIIAMGVTYVAGGKEGSLDFLKSFSASFLGTASFVISTALVYEIGKRGYISYLTEYLKKGDNHINVSLIHKAGKLKVGVDGAVWLASMAMGALAQKLLPTFAKHGPQWAGGVMMGQLAVNLWAQQTILQLKYNPFVWNNGAGKDQSVLIFPSKWTRMINADGTSVYKKLL
jgi:hypothetical protein